MCKVYNSVGSLTTLKSHLYKNNISEFKSLNEVIKFQRNYSASREQIISNHSLLIEQEKNTLENEIVQLNDSIKIRKNEVEQKLLLEIENLKQRLENTSLDCSNRISKFINFFKKIAFKIILWVNEISFNFKIKNSVRYSTNILTKKSNRYQYIVSFFEDAVNESSSAQLLEHERKKLIIDEINSSIYGALGEQKVVKELEKLSDDYTLINDFTFSFNPPLYNRQGNDYIKSVQIDHLLISTSGIFLIETKNWSENSINNLSLFSPVQQIKRTSFALYKILTKAINKSNFELAQHHWGSRKIPIRNLIVLINQKPKEDFQFVKILTLNELRGYVEYFTPSFSSNETETIVNYLLNVKCQ